MRPIDVANLMVARYGGRTKFTNTIPNKLVYFAQVESLRMFGTSLFDDATEAWDYGPVEPAVYYAFKRYGRSRIASPSQSHVSCDENDLAAGFRDASSRWSNTLRILEDA